MTAHAPDPQDSVQIIARFVRGNWDLPEQVGAGLIEELASEGWIITRAQVFNDMLAALKDALITIERAAPNAFNNGVEHMGLDEGDHYAGQAIDGIRAAIAEATGSGQ